MDPNAKEEKLRAAREKLRKYQESKRANNTVVKEPTPEPANVNNAIPAVTVQDDGGNAASAPTAPHLASFYLGPDASVASFADQSGVAGGQDLSAYFGAAAAAAGGGQRALDASMLGLAGSFNDGDGRDYSTASMAVNVGGSTAAIAGSDADDDAAVDPARWSTVSLTSRASELPLGPPVSTLEAGGSLAQMPSAQMSSVQMSLAQISSTQVALSEAPEASGSAQTNDVGDLERRLEERRVAMEQLELQNANLSSQLAAMQQALQSNPSSEDEVRALRERLSAHEDSLRLLVEEKAAAAAEASAARDELGRKNDEIASLTARLAASHQSFESTRAAEAELESARAATAAADRARKDAAEELAERQGEIVELKSRLRAREGEVSTLRAALDERSSALELAELNLRQIRAATDADANTAAVATKADEEERRKDKARLSELEAANATLLARESELADYIAQAGRDREQIIQQYTAYCQQLTTQMESANAQLGERMVQAEAMEKRESDLLSHVERLESQLQEAMAKSPSVQAESMVKRSEEEVEEMRARMEEEAERTLREAVGAERAGAEERMREKAAECALLSARVSELESVVSDLETRNEMLRSTSRSVNDDSTSSSDLVAACESDKVAASRAVAQNLQLKEQLEELQTAVVRLTNEKAEALSDLDTLTRRLSARGREEGEGEALRAQVAALTEAVAERDRTVEQLRAQIKYYVAFAENSLTGRATPTTTREEDAIKEKERTEKELAEAKERIRCLDSHLSELRGQLEVLSAPTREPSNSNSPGGGEQNDEDVHRSSSSASSSGSSSLSSSSMSEEEEEEAVDLASKDQGQKKALIAATVNGNSNNKSSSSNNNNNIPTLTPDVAFVKLEQRFNAAMERLARVEVEKEELEHLNVQLQEETETVGEYITIYQYQRQQIKLRMAEKETQLAEVQREKEELRMKLGQLQQLFTSYLKEKGDKFHPALAPSATASATQDSTAATTPSNPHQPPSSSASSTSSYVMLQEEAKQQRPPGDEGGVPATKAEEASSSATSTTVTSTTKTTTTTANMATADGDTAGQILALLTEIGSNQMLREDFHPWFWERSQGKLMDV